MRPTADYLLSLEPVCPKETLASLWALRSSRATRYAHAPRISQQQRRRAVRRACPHGWTR